MTAFGHRLMMDVIVPGGLARDMTREGINEVRSLLDTIEYELSTNSSSFTTTRRRFRTEPRRRELCRPSWCARLVLEVMSAEPLDGISMRVAILATAL